MERQAALGIEAISVYTPRQYLHLRELATARGVDPDKYIKGLGLHCMAVPLPSEDAVTMAVEAAHNLLNENAIDPQSIGMVIVGTESSVDAAKPIASYVHGFLNLASNCCAYDITHACYGATAGLKAAIDWCRNNRSTNARALVIATDIARYDLESKGEPTQGAGAVAMVVSANPRVARLDFSAQAVITRHCQDFWRPLYRHCALVDGPYSIECYLTSLEESFHLYMDRLRQSLHDFKYLLFHTPFPRLSQKAHDLVFTCAQKRGDTNGISCDASFRQRTGPSLHLNREIGNAYSASLYLSLAGLLHAEGVRAEGARLGLFSYGSGSCAEFFSATLGPDSAAWANLMGIHELVDARTPLTINEYEKIRQETAKLNASESFPQESRTLWEGQPSGFINFFGIHHHRRIYAPQIATADIKVIFDAANPSLVS